MNIEDPIDALWSSSANRPRPEAGENLASKFTARMRRRRRFQAWWLAWTVLALSVITVGAGAQIIRGNLSETGDVLPMILLLAFPWGAAGLFLRRFFGGSGDASNQALPVRSAFLAAQRSNTDARRNIGVVGMLYLVMIPVLAWAVYQLHASGKASASEVQSMTLVFGVALTAGGVGIAVRYFRSLLPEKHEIESLLADYEAASES